MTALYENPRAGLPGLSGAPSFSRSFRDTRWRGIWEDRARSLAHRAPHAAGGYEFLSVQQYLRLVRHTLADTSLPAGARVLDVGCGAGAFALGVSQLHPRIRLHVSDPCQQMLKSAKQRLPHAVCTLAEAADLRAFGDESFDCVTCFGVFGYLRDKADALASLREMTRVLRRDGRLIVGDVALDSRCVDSESRFAKSSAPRELPACLLLSPHFFQDFATLRGLSCVVRSISGADVAWCAERRRRFNVYLSKRPG